MSIRTSVMTSVAALLLIGSVDAAEIGIRLDRDRIRQGESALVTITVRKTAQRPVVTPPSVPYCQIELAGERQSRSSTPQRGTARNGAAGTNQRLGQALSELDQQLQKLPGDLARQTGPDSILLG